MTDAPALLAGRLGGVPVFGADTGAYRFGQWRFAGGGRLEVLEPAETDGVRHRFLAQRSPGIHHVTFKVPSLGAACERAAAHGYASARAVELPGAPAPSAVFARRPA